MKYTIQKRVDGKLIGSLSKRKRRWLPPGTNKEKFIASEDEVCKQIQLLKSKIRFSFEPKVEYTASIVL